MTPEKRLNQLEPYVAEMSAQLDRVAAQNNTLKVQNQQIIDTLLQHSDSIQFLLSGQADLKTGQNELRGGQNELGAGQTELRVGQNELRVGQNELRAGQAKLEGNVADLKTGQDELMAGQAKVENSVSDLKVGQTRLEQNVSLLIQLIQNMNGNGRSQ